MSGVVPCVCKKYKVPSSGRPFETASSLVQTPFLGFRTVQYDNKSVRLDLMFSKALPSIHRYTATL
jgi:hypothetical protein